MEASDYRERIYGIFADPSEDIDSKIRRALEVGREFLGVSIGFVSGIDHATQTIEYAVGEHPLIQTGETCPLDQAYCRRTVQLDSVLAVHEAAGSSKVSDLAFETFGLGTYIGAKVVTNDEAYGTVCFADEAERGRPFTEAESYFVELLARLVGHAFERAAYERELDERSEIYRSVVESSFDLVFRLDAAGEFTYLSSTVEPLLGEEPEAYLGRHFTAILPNSETVEQAEGLFERVLDGETVEEYDFPLNHAYGHRVWVDIRVSPVYDRQDDAPDSGPSSIVGAQGMVRDATGRRRRTQHIQVLNRVLRHNLRNDMNVINGYAEILSDRLTGDDAEFADRILDTGADLLKIAETARDLEALLETPARLERMDVVPIVTEAVSDVSDVYPAATFRVDTPASVGARGTPQLAAAIRELVDNAAKHAGESPIVDLSVVERGESVEIRVADDGPGLPEQERSVLESGEETALNHGSGLGLWLVYAVVENLNGQLRVDDDNDATAVTIVLQSTRSA